MLTQLNWFTFILAIAKITKIIYSNIYKYQIYCVYIYIENIYLFIYMIIFVFLVREFIDIFESGTF